PEFGDLLLMMCCLEANHIPRAFLETYKPQLVVDTFMLQMKKYSLIHQESSSGAYLYLRIVNRSVVSFH
ncbi:MAG: hypothetical protein Q7T55_11215, partial [Solirubrobacteraceae bacterium]|nr:hypothetical protein [Solirubrobacteraceae bacterium]